MNPGRKFIKTIFIFLFIFLPALLFPQIENIKFDRISIENGLSQSSIFAILQDNQGFLWFGTQNGLNKYDGINFKVYKYNPYDSTSLTDNWVQKLLECTDGTIWVGTYSGGLFRFDRDKGTFTNYRHNPDDSSTLINNRIWSLFEDSKGTLWVGTAGGLSILEKESISFNHLIRIKNYNLDFSKTTVNAVIEDDNNILWLGTWGGGLIKYNRNNNSFEKFFNDDSFVNVKIKSMTADGDYLWLATSGNGLIKFNKKDKSFRIYSRENGFSDNSVLSVIKDSKNNIWAGTHQNGLVRINEETGEMINFRYNPQNQFGICDNWVQAIVEDASGIIWIGTGDGINKFVPERQGFVHLQNNPEDPNSLVGDDVRAILEDNYGDVWMGTWSSGLSRYNRIKNTFTNYKNNPKNPYSIPSNIVTAIYQDKDGDLWFGTSMGLARFIRDKNNFEIYRHSQTNPNSLGYNNISCLAGDKYGNLWIGTWHGGLSIYNKKEKRFKNYRSSRDEKSISDDIITHIFEDRDGIVYIGTNAGGLNIYNRKDDSFIKYQYSHNDRNSISNNSITRIYQDKEGTIWIGTLGGGLNIFNKKNKTFTQITESDGLIDNAIFGITEDDIGNLWLSTGKGLSAINLKTQTITNYDTKDGLIDQEFNPGVFKCKDGLIFLGGRKGVTIVNPVRVSLNQYKAPVVINSFKVYDKEKELDKEISRVDDIELAYNEDAISISYVALNYSRSERLEYSYMLEGFDKDWVSAGSRRTAYYTNLTPGKYVFKVKANNGNDVWSESKTPLSITIVPPIWKRWWFILATGLFLVAVGTLIYQYRVNRLLEIERLRTKIAQDLHDELASNLSSIAMFSKIIFDEGKSYFSKTSSASQLLERITTLSQESVTSIREIIWALDPKPETILDLLIRLRDMIISSCRAKNIVLHCDFPNQDLLPARNLSPEVRKNLWMLFKEALNNSVKHSECTELYFIAVYDGNILRVIIKDNGKGFNPGDKFSGKGLTTMKRRADELNTVFELTSEKGLGTTMMIEVKI